MASSGVTLYNILSRSTHFCEVIGDNTGKDMRCHTFNFRRE